MHVSIEAYVFRNVRFMRRVESFRHIYMGQLFLSISHFTLKLNQLQHEAELYILSKILQIILYSQRIAFKVIFLFYTNRLAVSREFLANWVRNISLAHSLYDRSSAHIEQKYAGYFLNLVWILQIMIFPNVSILQAQA